MYLFNYLPSYSIILQISRENKMVNNKHGSVNMYLDIMNPLILFYPLGKKILTVRVRKIIIPP